MAPRLRLRLGFDIGYYFILGKGELSALRVARECLPRMRALLAARVSMVNINDQYQSINIEASGEACVRSAEETDASWLLRLDRLLLPDCTVLPLPSFI